MNYNKQILQKLDSKNKARIWIASTDFKETEVGITINISHGLQGGKQVTKQRFITAGKNIGKSNETTIKEQAQLELNSLYQSQIDKGYVFDLEDFVVRHRPILAFTFEEKKHKVKWGNPHYASQKLNGVRCFTKVKNKQIVFESRTEKEFKYFHHFQEEIEFLRDNLGIGNIFYIDAEFYHPTMPFEIICKLVNTQEYISYVDEHGKEWSTEDLELHVYDIVIPSMMDLTYSERFLPFKSLFDNLKTLKFVEQYLVTTEDEFIQLGKSWILLGFEGGMLRADVAYEFNIRSINLLKFKIMVSEEFKILDIYVAENDDNKVMFLLRNHHNSDEKYNTFKSGIEGSKDLTKGIYTDRKSYIDKSWLTVEFQTLSSYNVPLFPVGIAIREGEDIDGMFVPST